MSTTTDAGIELTAEQFSVALHNGMVTIESPTGQHRTFRVQTRKSGKLAGKRVVELLVGPDRDDYESWDGFGFATDAGVQVWRSRQGQDGVPSCYDTFGRMLSNPARWAARGCRYLVQARCRRCNRDLTVPASIDTGYGPECVKKAGAGL